MRGAAWDVIGIVGIIVAIFMVLTLLSDKDRTYQKAYDEGFNAAMEEAAKESFNNKYTATKLKDAILLTPKE